MKHSLSVLLVFLVCVVPEIIQGQRAVHSQTFDDCNTLYHDGAYDQAVSCYQTISSNGHSAALFYNIANSYALSGQTGHAVLYYLRALRLSPGDSDISGNLELLKKEKGLFSPDRSLTEQFFSILTVSQWSLFCLFALAAYVVYSLLQLKRGRNARTEPIIILFCALLFILGSVGAGIRYGDWQRSVVLNDSRLLVSPFTNAASIGSIQQGRLVSPHKQHNEYWYVTDETGRKGWLQTTAFKPIMLH